MQIAETAVAGRFVAGRILEFLVEIRNLCSDIEAICDAVEALDEDSFGIVAAVEVIGTPSARIEPLSVELSCGDVPLVRGLLKVGHLSPEPALRKHPGTSVKADRPHYLGTWRRPPTEGRTSRWISRGALGATLGATVMCELSR